MLCEAVKQQVPGLFTSAGKEGVLFSFFVFLNGSVTGNKQCQDTPTPVAAAVAGGPSRVASADVFCKGQKVFPMEWAPCLLCSHRICSWSTAGSPGVGSLADPPAPE